MRTTNWRRHNQENTEVQIFGERFNRGWIKCHRNPNAYCLSKRCLSKWRWNFLKNNNPNPPPPGESSHLDNTSPSGGGWVYCPVLEAWPKEEVLGGLGQFLHRIDIKPTLNIGLLVTFVSVMGVLKNPVTLCLLVALLPCLGWNRF